MNILLIEDNLGDVYLIQAAIDELGIEYSLNTVHYGDIAISYLQHYDEKPLPDLILLDIKLPEKNGFEVLAEIKSKEKLKDIPVIVISSSFADADKEKAKALGAAGFITKPADYNEYTRQVSAAIGFMKN